MPLYEFRCENCGQTFEVRQTIEEHMRGKPTCPRCQSADRVESVPSPFFARTSSKH